MERLNIKKSVLSMSSPGTHLTLGNDEEGWSLTCRVKEDMLSDYLYTLALATISLTMGLPMGLAMPAL